MKKWYISPNVVLREEADDWGVLFDPDTGNSVVLNPIAITIFKVMKKTQSIAEVKKVIEDEYDEVSDGVEDDIVDLLEALARDGFIGFGND